MNTFKSKDIAMQETVKICASSAFAYGLFVTFLYFIYLLGGFILAFKTASAPLIAPEVQLWSIWFLIAAGLMLAIPFAKFVYRYKLNELNKDGGLTNK